MKKQVNKQFDFVKKWVKRRQEFVGIYKNLMIFVTYLKEAINSLQSTNVLVITACSQQRSYEVITENDFCFRILENQIYFS